MRVLVTGAAGFIGMHTSLRLLERGDEVVGYDDLNAYYDPALKAARPARLQAHPAFTFVKSVYGAGTKLPFSVADAVDHPMSLYAATKQANEQLEDIEPGDVTATWAHVAAAVGPWR